MQAQRTQRRKGHALERGDTEQVSEREGDREEVPVELKSDVWILFQVCWDAIGVRWGRGVDKEENDLI